MTSLNPSAFACLSFRMIGRARHGGVFAPKARANCVTALPIDPPIAGASYRLACLKNQARGKKPTWRG